MEIFQILLPSLVSIYLFIVQGLTLLFVKTKKSSQVEASSLIV